MPLKMNYMKRVARYFRKLQLDAKRLLRMRAEPRRVAAGVAVGVFIGVFPTFGTGIFLTLFLGRYWKFHIPAALLAGTLSIAPPLGTGWIVLSAYVGGIRPEVILDAMKQWNGLFHLGAQFLGMYFWGCLLVSTGAAIAGYLLVMLSASLFGAKRGASSQGHK